MVWIPVSWKMRKLGPLLKDPSKRGLCFCRIFSIALVLCFFFFCGTIFLTFDQTEKQRIIPQSNNSQKDSSDAEKSDSDESHKCKARCKPLGSGPLPEGIIQATTNFEMDLWDSPETRKPEKLMKSLLAIPVGIKQKEIVNKIVTKFPADNFTVMLFHYDGVVDEWSDLHWSDSVLHISAINQTKWWFGKRFLHPDMIAEYDYIFLWDEDIEVENFDPLRYLSIVQKQGFEISQPALGPRSQIHHRITARTRRKEVHRRIYKYNGNGRCYENSTAPPCTGWVEMMVPVFSRAAWRCAWYMIQNDLKYAWGMDYKLGYCARGDRSLTVGVVDTEYVVHKGIPTLGGQDENKVLSGSPPNDKDRYVVRQRSYNDMKTFNRRWKNAVARDKCWTDPYPE